MNKIDKYEIKKTLFNMRKELQSYEVSNIGLFGSYVRETQNKNSDIDLLVDFEAPIDLFRYANLMQVLEKKMGHKVDLVTLKGIKPAIRNSVLEEVEWIA